MQSFCTTVSAETPAGENPKAVKKSPAPTAHDKKANFFIYQ